MREQCLAQEHNAVPRPRLKSRSLNPESGALTIRPPRLPKIYIGDPITIIENKKLLSVWFIFYFFDILILEVIIFFNPSKAVLSTIHFTESIQRESIITQTLALFKMSRGLGMSIQYQLN